MWTYGPRPRYPTHLPASRMSTSKKGFDPLGSLFDLPDPGPAVSPPPAKGQDVPDATNVKPLGPRTGPDPVELAKILARAAQAKAGIKKPAPSTTLVPESAPGTKAAKPARPAAAAPPAPAAPAPAPAATAKPARPAAAPAPAAPASRLAGAPPPRRTLSAADALRAAQEEESRAAAERAAAPAVPAAPAPAAAPPRAPAAAAAPPVASAMPEDALADVVSGIIRDSFPSLGDVYVARALVMDDRGVLTALWRAHRARFISNGDMGGAVSVLAVLRALASVARGQLVAAHAVTDKSDWLLWIDLSTTSPVAAFRDARAWLVGG